MRALDDHPVRNFTIFKDRQVTGLVEKPNQTLEQGLRGAR
jgi:hypothetical protein